MDLQEQAIRVLLVDDELEFLDATARALARRGCAVRQAADGEAALAALAAELPDVVVLDVKMPGRDGVEVFHEISRRWPRLPVILLTGHGTVQQAFRTSREGVHAYLSKPCEIERLLAVLREAAARALPGPPAAGEGDELRVLLIDDEVELLDALARTLSRRGLQVLTAAGGGEALQTLQRQVVDVVLCDVKMPGLDGIDLLRRIKTIQPPAEVILLTGHPDVGVATQGLQEGAADYLVKPQTPEALAEKIHEAGRRKRRRDEQERQRRLDELRDRQPD